MERYAMELSEKAIALMSSTSRTGPEAGCDLLMQSVKTLIASKPRYP